MKRATVIALILLSVAVAGLGISLGTVGTELDSVRLDRDELQLDLADAGQDLNQMTGELATLQDELRAQRWMGQEQVHVNEQQIEMIAQLETALDAARHTIVEPPTPQDAVGP